MRINICNIDKYITGEIIYGVSDTEFGRTFIAIWDGKIIALKFVDADDNIFINDLKRAYKYASIIKDNAITKVLLNKILSSTEDAVFDVAVLGSPFKISVYKALINVRYGTTISYLRLASAAGYPKAVRATASAIARNETAVLIPCHRVVRTDGGLGGYRWGTLIKEALIASECKCR
ncbi:MAG: methylated-DNA--[protein]-cysteine S-methyltransferase [Bacteroidales bacterium]